MCRPRLLKTHAVGQGSHRGKVNALNADQLQFGLHLKARQSFVSAPAPKVLLCSAGGVYATAILALARVQKGFAAEQAALYPPAMLVADLLAELLPCCCVWNGHGHLPVVLQPQ